LSRDRTAPAPKAAAASHKYNALAVTRSSAKGADHARLTNLGLEIAGRRSCGA
jgi:hypothetical protein